MSSNAVGQSLWIAAIQQKAPGFREFLGVDRHAPGPMANSRSSRANSSSLSSGSGAGSFEEWAVDPSCDQALRQRCTDRPDADPRVVRDDRVLVAPGKRKPLGRFQPQLLAEVTPFIGQPAPLPIPHAVGISQGS